MNCVQVPPWSVGGGSDVENAGGWVTLWGFFHVLCGQHWIARQGSALGPLQDPSWGNPALGCRAISPPTVRGPRREGFAGSSLCSNFSFSFHCQQGHLCSDSVLSQDQCRKKNSCSKSCRASTMAHLPLPLPLMSQH